MIGDFVARELATSGLLLPLRPWSRYPRFDSEATSRPGGVVAELRRIRGLD